MSKRTSKTKLDFTIQVPENISGLLHPYFDKFLADDSLSDLHVLLLSLYLLEKKNGAPGINYDHLKTLFVWLGRKERPNFGVAIHTARQQNLVEKNHTNVILFKIRGLKALESLIGLKGGKSPVFIIKAGHNFSAIKRFEEFLIGQLGGSLILCDSHISPDTLYPFTALSNKANSLRILSSNIYEPNKFAAYLQKLRVEIGLRIEVRKSLKIHDRYLISGDKCWSLGGSIKDLGNKDTVLVELPGVTSSLKDLFEQRWGEAKPF